MVEIKNLEFSYGSSNVFENLTMTILPGKIYGLLGENGVGKTTLLKIMCGLLFPVKGEVEVDGVKSSKRSPETLESIYFVPENLTFPNQKVLDYAESRGIFYKNFDKNKFLEYMKMFDTDPCKNFVALSFGQKKKAFIAFAFSTGTKYIFLDEPGNGLDIPSKTQLRKIISTVADENRCIVISTHQVRDLENIIDPIIILDKKSVLINASIEEISKKLSFTFKDRLDPSALYNEPTPGGYLTVKENEEGIEQMVNIEALFNAAVSNKSKISEIFKNR